MKKVLYRIATILFEIRYLLLYRGLIVKNAYVCDSKINGAKNNSICFSEGFFNKSSILIDGRLNSIECRGNIRKLNIRVYGNNCVVNIESNVTILGGEIVLRGDNCRISIGKNTSFGHSLYVVCMGNGNIINIGPECMFADHVDIWNSDSHPLFDVSGLLINPSMPVVIGKHVWVGKYAKILKGVTIEDDAIVGMNSIVTSSLKARSLNVGIPSKLIKENVFWDRSFITNYEN